MGAFNPESPWCSPAVSPRNVPLDWSDFLGSHKSYHQLVDFVDRPVSTSNTTTTGPLGIVLHQAISLHPRHEVGTRTESGPGVRTDPSSGRVRGSGPTLTNPALVRDQESGWELTTTPFDAGSTR